MKQPLLLPPVKKSPVLDDKKVPMVGQLENTHLDILPFFPSDFLKLIFF
jgi:hypothetical protein